MERFPMTVTVPAMDVSGKNDNDAAKERIVKKLSELSALPQRVDRAAEEGRMMIALMMAALPKDSGAGGELLFAMQRAHSFDSHVMRQDAIAYIKRNLEGVRADRAIQRFSSPLAVKMARLEVDALKSMRANEPLDYRRSPNIDEPSLQKRLGLIERLNLATGARDHVVEMKVFLLTLAIDSIARLLPPDNQPCESDKERLINLMRMRTAEYADFHLLYAFGPVPDAELEQYAQICETDEGMWFAKITRGAATHASARAFAKMVKMVRLANLAENLSNLPKRFSMSK